MENRRPPGMWMWGLAIVLAVSSIAQEPQPADKFTASFEVSTIIIPITVKDKKGRLISTLEGNQFRLFIDDIEYPVKNFWREGGLPVSYAFVLDTSGSMGTRRLSKAREVIMDFVRFLKTDDEVCLITFGAGEVKRRFAFGMDPAQLPKVLDPLKGFGTTALYDMLTAAPQIMEGAKNMRRAIMLFTDGVDTSSEMTPGDVVKVLETISDSVYAFGIEPPPSDEGPPDSYENVLKQFAATSGGRYIRVDRAAKLPEFGGLLRRELTMRYIINLDPSGVGAIKWRKIEVKVKGDYTVQARQGYRGTLPGR